MKTFAHSFRASPVTPKYPVHGQNNTVFHGSREKYTREVKGRYLMVNLGERVFLLFGDRGSLSAVTKGFSNDFEVAH